MQHLPIAGLVLCAVLLLPFRARGDGIMFSIVPVGRAAPGRGLRTPRPREGERPGGLAQARTHAQQVGERLRALHTRADSAGSRRNANSASPPANTSWG